MEETGQTTIYDNYKFLTKEDLEKLGMTNLIGTDLLKAQMHGYFVNHNLYKKVSRFDIFVNFKSSSPPRCFCLCNFVFFFLFYRLWQRLNLLLMLITWNARSERN